MAIDYPICFSAELSLEIMAELNAQSKVMGSDCDLISISVTIDTFAGTGDELFKIFRKYLEINWCECRGFDDQLSWKR